MTCKEYGNIRLWHGEQIKYVSGYEGIYLITNHGRVFRNGKQLKPQIDSSGYPIISLCNSGQKSFRIHRLVAKAFIPNKENKPCINHKDGNKENNFYKNLEWVTRGENNKHASENGLNDVRGESNVTSKLCREDVINIKKRYKNSESVVDICKDYPVCKSHIYKILRGDTWGHL